nr:winged helix-turn-helix domain-containing protein [Clostridium sp. DSM 17811]
MTIELPPKEFDLIYKFLSYPGMIFTKAQLLNEIWGYDSESSEDTVKTHVSRLRNKLVEFQEFQIVTIKGLGYKGIIIDN